MTAIIGVVSTASHNMERPVEAPATEYVEMPDGSSSAAPVIRPGPSACSLANSVRCLGVRRVREREAACTLICGPFYPLSARLRAPSARLEAPGRRLGSRYVDLRARLRELFGF